MSCTISCSQLEAEPKPEPKDVTSTHSKQVGSLAPPSLTVVGSKERLSHKAEAGEAGVSGLGLALSRAGNSSW